MWSGWLVNWLQDKGATMPTCVEVSEITLGCTDIEVAEPPTDMFDRCG